MSLRIVLAEDETIIRMDLREQLENLGYQVVADVTDGEAAVKVSRESRPDVVVMDIKMPGMDGISGARKLTGETICPVVLVTAFSDAELIGKANEAGVMAYVMKPIRQGDLNPAIELAVSRFSEYRLLVDEVKDLAQRLETRKLLERAKGILMDSHKLSETQAFQRIQKISMDRRKSMKDVAEAILLADDLNA